MSVRRVGSVALVIAGAAGCNGLLGISIIPNPHDDGGMADSSTMGSRDAADDRDALDGSPSKADDGGDASTIDASDASTTDASDASTTDASDASMNDASSRSDASSECYPTPSGIVSWWRAEGSAIDSIGPNNGTETGVTYGVGMVGQAFHFDGAAYVSAGASGFPVLSDDRTVEMWARISISYPDAGATAEAQGLFFGYGEWNTEYGTYELLVAGGGDGNFPENTVTFSSWGDAITTSPQLTEGQWHHLAVTLTDGEIAIYLDGAPTTQSTDMVTIETTGAGTTYLGAFPVSLPTSPSCWLTGDVDEAAVYSRALTPDEIRGIFTAGANGKCP